MDESQSKMFDVIVTCDCFTNFIGFPNEAKWSSFTQNVKYFHNLTTHVNDDSKQNAVILGYNTWLTHGQKPFDNRINIVVSSKCKATSIVGGHVVFLPSLYQALLYCTCRKDIEHAFVIGGYTLFQEAVFHPCLKNIYTTVIYSDKIRLSGKMFPAILEGNSKFTESIIGCVKENENTTLIFKRFKSKSYKRNPYMIPT